MDGCKHISRSWLYFIIVLSARGNKKQKKNTPLLITKSILFFHTSDYLQCERKRPQITSRDDIKEALSPGTWDERCLRSWVNEFIMRVELTWCVLAIVWGKYLQRITGNCNTWLIWGQSIKTDWEGSFLRNTRSYSAGRAGDRERGRSTQHRYTKHK